MKEEIIGQALSILSAILTLITYQFNNKRIMFVILTSATVAMCASYLFLGASSGFALNVVCILRNVAFFFQKEQSKFRYPVTAVFVIAMIALGAISWQGAHSLLILCALAINTVALGVATPQWLRKSILLTSTLVLIYNIIEFSIGGMANEIIAITSSVIGIIRFHREKEPREKTHNIL